MIFKDFNRVIKVADLLHQSWWQDVISFEKKFLSDYDNLDANWFSGSVFLQSLNDREIVVVLQKMEASFEEKCDRCGKKYFRKVFVENYEMRYTLDFSEVDRENDVMPINSHWMIVDLSDQIYQAFELKKPLVFLCSDCEKIVDKQESDDYLELSSHISHPF